VTSHQDMEMTISNLHKMISQNETGLQLMRAEVLRLEKLLEPAEPQAAVASTPPTSSNVQHDPVNPAR
jgi:hypothetical protein